MKFLNILVDKSKITLTLCYRKRLTTSFCPPLFNWKQKLLPVSVLGRILKEINEVITNNNLLCCTRMAFCGLVNNKNNLELDNTEADFFSFYQSSGNPVFDHQLRMECNNLRCCFGVRCAVKLNGVRNSYATPLVLPVLDPYSDGLVTLGLPVLGHHLMNYDPTAGTIPFILAHEFGHIFSFKYNLGLAAGESTNKNEEL